MKILLSIFVFALCFGSTSAQSKETELRLSDPDVFQDHKKSPAFYYAEQPNDQKQENVPNALGAADESAPSKNVSAFSKTAPPLEVLKKSAETSTDANSADGEATPQIKEKEKFHWKPALVQSGIFLGIQHGFRMKQEKTRRELGGPFFRDWAQSVKNLRGWEDGDNTFTNYVAHPLQGGLTGRIFVNNSERAKTQEFGKSKKYWESRFKALAWSAAWSAQFELGPISEASIGNVGIRKKHGRSTMAWVDLVVTPTFGTAVVIAEDALDRYILKNWIEKKIRNKTAIKAFRIIFNPTTSFANILRWERLSKRDFRPL